MAIERFLSKVSKGHGCWEWKGGKFYNGYGAFFLQGKQDCAHRASYRLFKGKIPKGKYVLHTCDNPSCVKPEHLWLGSPRDNMLDKIAKGRARYRPLIGEQNPKSKLSEIQVSQIRLKYATGSSQRALGREYGVCKSTIGYIVRGENWKSITS